MNNFTSGQNPFPGGIDSTGNPNGENNSFEDYLQQAARVAALDTMFQRATGQSGNEDKPTPTPSGDDTEGMLAALLKMLEEEDEDDDSLPFNNDDDRPSFFRSDDDDDDDDDDNDTASIANMDSDDIHNKAVRLARNGQTREAARVCIQGLKKFHNDVDLLADTIMYSSDSGDTKTAAFYFNILKTQVPYFRWNWRAFSFSMNYLLTDPVANEAECRDIIAACKQYLPHSEKAAVSESQLEIALGNRAAGMQVLQDAINTHPNACQSALRLADMQMDHGMFAEVADTALYALAASAEAQPSINIPYMALLLALSKDHLLFMSVRNGQSITIDDVNKVRECYTRIKDKFPDRLRSYMSVINTRIGLLDLLELFICTE